MKKLFAAVLLSAVCSALSAVSAAAASVPTGTGNFRVPNAGLSTNWVYESDWNRWQSVVNDPGSSCLLRMPDCEPVILADHENQDFARLFDVEEGDAAVMTYADGTSDVFVCSEVLEGQCESAVCPACGWLSIGHGDAHVADGFLRLGLIVIEVRDALLGVGLCEGEGRGT